MTIARKYNLRVIEDAAQGVNALYKGRALGAIGDLGTYSFHETKNYICGEGGALCLNSPELVERAEIIRDKGTNRKQFFRGQVDKYTWVEVGSSYVPSEICSAFLYGQLEALDAISARRQDLYLNYYRHLAPLADEGLLRLPNISEDCESNYHLFYILLPDNQTRDALMNHLKEHNILAVFHYVPLHTAPMGRKYGYKDGDLPVTEDLAGRLLRLPLYYDLTEADQMRVVSEVKSFLQQTVTQSRSAASTMAEASPMPAFADKVQR